MESEYHYPPEVFNLLVDTIPLLCRSKRDVIIFFRGAGVSETVFKDLEHQVENSRDSIKKHEIARVVLQRINEKGDSALRARREIIKRIVEFEEFSSCWPDDQMKAKGCVSELRKIVNVKDAFVKINQERKREREGRIAEVQRTVENEKKKKSAIDDLKQELFSLFPMENEPQKRGKQLEKILNKLFQVYGVLVKEDFRRSPSNCNGVIEQIDGVIEFDGNIYIVEMKWVKEPIGVDKIASHLVRLYNRADTRAIFITSSSYTTPAIEECREVLAKKTIVLCTLQEIVLLLEKQEDLVHLFRQKVRAAAIDKEPFVEFFA